MLKSLSSLKLSCGMGKGTKTVRDTNVKCVVHLSTLA